MRRILLLMHGDAACIYIWCFRMHADYGEKVMGQKCAKWLLTQQLWKAHPPRQKGLVGFLIGLCDLKNLLNSWKWYKRKLKPSSFDPYGKLAGSQVWWRSLVHRRAYVQMCESFVARCLHPEPVSEMNRELMKILEGSRSMLSTAPTSQEGSVCCTCWSPGAVWKCCCTSALLQHHCWWHCVNNHLPACKTLLSTTKVLLAIHPYAVLKEWGGQDTGGSPSS